VGKSIQVEFLDWEGVETFPKSFVRKPSMMNNYTGEEVLGLPLLTFVEVEGKGPHDSSVWWEATIVGNPSTG
jgi:hypothetical protein